jgi:hypothetical protein
MGKESNTLFVIQYSSVSRGSVYWTGSDWTEDIESGKLFPSKDAFNKEVQAFPGINVGSKLVYLVPTRARVHRMLLGRNCLT